MTGLFHRLRFPWGRPTLRTLLTILFVAQLAIALSLTRHLAMDNGRQNVQSLVSTVMEHVSDHVEGYVTEYLTTPTEIAQLNAEAMEAGMVNLTNQDATQDYLRKELSIFTAIRALTFVNEQQEYFSIRQPSDDGYFVCTANQNTNYKIQHRWIDSEGEEHLLTEPHSFMPYHQVSEIPWYQEVRRTQQASWWLSTRLLTADQPLLVASRIYPVHNKQWEFEGAAVASFYLSQMSDFLASIGERRNGDVLIVDRSGTLVATSGQEPLFTNGQPKYGEGLESRFYRLNLQHSSNPLYQTILQQLNQQIGGLKAIANPVNLQLEVNHERYFIGLIPLKESQEMDWLSLIILRENDFIAQVQAQDFFTGRLLSLIGVGAIALAAITARWLTQPTERLSRAFQAIAQEDFQPQLSLRQPTVELVNMVQAFNQMSDRVHHSFRQMQRSLRSSEEKFTKVFQVNPDPIMVTTLETGQFLYVNDCFCQFTGYAIEEVIGRTSLSLNLWIEPGDRQDTIQQLQQEGQVRNVEYDCRMKTGEICTVLISANLIDLDGQQCILSVLKDITGRKQLFRSLQQREKQFRLITETIAEVVYVCDCDSQTLQYVSPAYERVFGRSCESAYADFSSFWGSIHPDDRLRVLTSFQQFKATGTEPITLEYRILRPDGEVRWLLDRAALIHDENGHPRYVAGAIEDITHRKLAEQHLQESQEQLSNILDSLDDIVWSVSCNDYRVLYMSAGVIKTYGRTPNEFLTNPDLWLTAIHPDDRPLAQKGREDLLTTGFKDQEYRILRPNGEMRWVRSRAKVVYDADGNPLRVDGIVSDITQRKLAVLALEESEARQRAILSALPDLIKIVSADGRFIDWVPPKNLVDIIPPGVNRIGRHLRELLPADIAERELFHLKRALATGQMQTYEHRVTAQEQVQYEQVRCVPIDGDRALFLVQNISERKQLEMALKASEAQFRLAFELAPIGMAMTDESGRILQVNQELCSMVGYSSEELLQMSCADLTHPDHQAEQIGLNRQLWKEAIRYYEHERQYIRKDRSIVDIWLKKAIIMRDVHAKPLYALSQIVDISDRKQAEEALRQSEERFREVAKTVSQLFFVKSAATGEYLYVSPAYERIWGRSVESLIANPASWMDAIHPEDYGQVVKSLRQQQQYTEEPVEQRYRIIRSDGEVRWIRAEISAVCDDTGEPVRYIGIAEDITERLQAEENLKNSEERWQLVLQGTNDGIWDWKIAQNSVFRSPRWFEMLGYEPTDIGGQKTDWSSLIHPDDYERTVQAQQDYLDRKLPRYTIEYRMRCQDGSYKWILSRGQAVWDESGNPIRLVGSHTDIHHLKQTEEALRQSEATFRQIAENIRDVFWVYDLTLHHKIYVSPAFEQIWGYSREALIQNPNLWEETIATEDRPQFRNMVDEVLLYRCSVLRQYRIVRADGSLRWISDRAFPIMDDKGTIYRLVGLAEDITERKQAEVSLLESLQEKEILLAEIHHRVKNNLQLVSSLLNLQANRTDDRDLELLLRESVSRVNAMVLIHDRIYCSNQFIGIDVRAYVRSLTTDLLRSYSRSLTNITLDLYVHPDVHLSLDQAVPFGLILNELVTNALKHGFAGQADGHLGIEVIPWGDRQIQLTVKNDGNPLPDNFTFEAYSLTSKSMGLRLILSLVEQIQGSIHTSTLEETSIQIRFPMR